MEKVEEIEKKIDEAIESGDFKVLLELLDEREKLLKDMGEVLSSIAEKILERDKERMEKIKRMMEGLKETAFRSRDYQESLKAFRAAQGNIQKRSWGRG